LLVKDIISHDVPELTLKDQPVNAINLMEEFKVAHLPVIEGEKYLGLVSEDELEVQGATQNGLLNPGHELMDISVHPAQHILDVLKLTAEHHLTVIPVAVGGHFEGCITLTDLIDHFARTQAASEPGGVIVLELNAVDYSLQEIAGIVEGNDAKILSATLTTIDNSNQVEVTIKINKEDLGGILQTFSRYDYRVKASFQEAQSNDDLQNRYDEFMKYMNI
jgi:CBS domain-containing protein